MEKIITFLKKNNKSLTIFLAGILSCLIIFALLKLTNLVNTSIFIKFKYIIVAGVINIFLLVLAVYQQVSENVKNIFCIITTAILIILLLLQILPLFSIEISFQIGQFATIYISQYSCYINFLIFLLIVFLLFIKRKTLLLQKNLTDRNKPNLLIFLPFLILYFGIQFYLLKKGCSTYSDEYNHLVSGESIVNGEGLPVLNMYFNGSGYLKGSPMSYIVALLFSLLGVSIESAKLAPIFLGAINLTIVYSLSLQFMKSNIVRIFSLLLFILNPLLIFNHFYIRHYVFLEFSLLLTVLMFSRICYSGKSTLHKSLTYILCIIFINIINFFLMYDLTRYIVPFATLIGILFFFMFKKINIFTNNKIVRFMNALSPQKRFLSLIIIFMTIFIVLLPFYNFTPLIENFFLAETNSSSSHYNFSNLFFGFYSFFFIFFIIGLFSTIFSKKNENLLQTYFICSSLLIIHFFSGESMQLLRAMIYILPLFFLLSAYGFENFISLFKEKILRILFVCIFLITSISIFNNDMTLTKDYGFPSVPKEITPIEYSDLYEYIKENLDDYLIIYVGYNNQRETFFGVKSDYKLDLKKSYLDHYAVYYDTSDNSYRQYYTDTKIITTRQDFINIFSKQKTCLILADFYNDFLPNSDVYRIKKSFKLRKDFDGFSIYCRDL